MTRDRFESVERQLAALRELSSELVRFTFRAISTGLSTDDLKSEQFRFASLVAATGEPHEQSDTDLLRETCDRIGYGRVMQIASMLWAEKAARDGQPGSNFLVGPCAQFAVPCFCAEDGSACNFCCGAGWLTKTVKALVRQVRS